MKITVEIPDEYKVFCKDKLQGFFDRIGNDMEDGDSLELLFDLEFLYELKEVFLNGEYEEE